MKRFLKASLMTSLVVGLMAFAVSAVRADTITFMTTGTFSSGQAGFSAVNTAPPGGLGTFSTATWQASAGNSLQIRFNGNTQSITVPPQGGGVNLGIFQTALNGTGYGANATGTFVLTITQSSPSGGTSSFTGALTANFVAATPPGGVGSVTFSTTSTTINGVTYTLSNSGVVTLTVPPNTIGTFSSPGNSVEATVNTVIPEPASMLLLGTGLVGVAGAVRRKLKTRNLN